MIRNVTQVDSNVTDFLIEEAREIWQKEGFTPDISNYAKGRQRVWIGEEPMLVGYGTKPGYKHPTLYKVLKQLMPKAEYFLLHSGKSINPHRDASALAAHAYGLQISGKATFLYASDRQGQIDTEIELVPGMLFEFNSKHLHGSKDVSSDRLAVNAWPKKARFRCLA